jgi:tetratricopeptide (TPR) repeat protein
MFPISVRTILLGIVFLLNTLSLFSIPTKQVEGDNHSIPDQDVSIAQIDSVLKLFNTFDYVRSNKSKEETINWLIIQSEKLKYNPGIARGKNLKGVLLRDRTLYDQAIELHKSALEIAGNDTMIMIYSLNDLGVAYRRLDKPRIALDYHLKALELSEKFKGDLLVAQRSACVALNSIGNINLSLNQPEQALEMFNQSLEKEKQLNNELGIAINFQNIGYAYQAMKEPDVALSYFQKSLQYNEKINSMVGRSICLNSIGEIFLQKNEPIEALKNFKIALLFAEKTDDDYYVSQSHANLGKAYLQLDRPDIALPELEKFNGMALKINSGTLIKDSYQLLSEYYEKKGNLKLSLEYFKTSVAFNDSIANEKNLRYLNELQTLYDAKKKEQQIELLTAGNEIKNQRLIILLILVLTILISAIFVYFNQRKKTKQQKTELKLKLLRSQMDPHFIFNALGSIQSFMYQNESGKAASYLGQFSSLTRSVLKNSNKELITLEEELETLKNFIEIEKMRKRGCFNYELEIDENIEPDFIYVPPIFLQPFVENAIQHGFAKKECDQGMISIQIKQQPKSIQITITDNGQGINSASKNNRESNHQSMGMKIFKDRIHLIERKYKKTVKFEVCDLSEKNPELTGTSIKIEFPLIEPDDKSSHNRRRTRIT